MRKIREVLRVPTLGPPQWQIARSCPDRQSTVSESLKAVAASLSFDRVAGWDGVRLTEALFGKTPPALPHSATVAYRHHRIPARAGTWFLCQNVGMNSAGFPRIAGGLLLPVAALLALCSMPLAKLAGQGAPAGTVERAKAHGVSLEGNLSGDSPDRDVSVYLPPGYAASGSRRYPVIYMLHGFTDSDDKWMGPTKHWIHLPTVLSRAIAEGRSGEFIVVMPNAYTRFQGSMYSSGVTTGDWESFVSKELVAWVDGRYRTLPKRESRGLAGHSMGGYGAMRIGMKHPEVFSSVYLLSPCCLSPTGRRGRQGQGPNPAELVRDDDAFAKASFAAKIMIAGAAAWAPNPTNPPFYLDLPVKDGEPRTEVAERLSANALLTLLDQYIYAIRSLKGFAFDAGDKDTGIAATIRTLDERLNQYGVPHKFAIYEGDHVNRVEQRIETEMLPFFSKLLARD